MKGGTIKRALLAAASAVGLGSSAGKLVIDDAERKQHKKSVFAEVYGSGWGHLFGGYAVAGNRGTTFTPNGGHGKGNVARMKRAAKKRNSAKGKK